MAFEYCDLFIRALKVQLIKEESEHHLKTLPPLLEKVCALSDVGKATVLCWGEI